MIVFALPDWRMLAFRGIAASDSSSRSRVWAVPG
jgi:hypothetical protein